MNIEGANAILGHASKDTTRRTAAALNMLITRGTLKTCESCVISKAKQKNLNQESEGTRANKFNGQVYHDIAMVKEDREDKKSGRKTVWHITAEETVNFKRSRFFVYKSEMTKDMCAFMQQEKTRGHLIEIIRQDNAGENKKLVTLAQSKAFGEAGIVKNKKDGKVGDRGITMMFVGYANSLVTPGTVTECTIP